MLVDASPLIYLAKLDALDVFTNSGYVPLVTPEIERETSRPALAYDHPDSLLIAEAIRTGTLRRTELTEDETRVARRLQEQVVALKPGEAEALAAAQARQLPVLLFEHRALRLAGSLRLDVWTPERLLFAGTADRARLRERILGFARLVNLPFTSLENLLNEVEEQN
jgi:predicted nucleic acid-binding protein